MVELKIYLTEGLNEKFRRIAMTVYGYGRGSLSKAAEAAFENWCSEHQASNPVQVAHLENVEANVDQPRINPEERNIESKGSSGDVAKESKPAGQSQ